MKKKVDTILNSFGKVLTVSIYLLTVISVVYNIKSKSFLLLSCLQLFSSSEGSFSISSGKQRVNMFTYMFSLDSFLLLKGLEKVGSIQF